MSANSLLRFPLKFISEDIEDLYQKNLRYSFRTIVRFVFPILVAILVLSSWDTLQIVGTPVSILIILGTLLCFLIITILSFTVHSRKQWYLIATAIVHTNCFLGINRSGSALIYLGISLVYALRNEFTENMYVTILIGLSYVTLQYPFSILLGAVIYNLLATLVVIAANDFTRDWKYVFLTLLMSILLLFFSYTLEYFTRKTYVKEIKLKVDLQRAKNEIEKTETLITNSIPILIAKQFYYGRNPLADKFPACTVVAIDIVFDISQLVPLYSVIDPVENIVLINEVLGVLDSVALKYDLYVVKISATEYIAVSGLPQPISGHTRKAIDFALEAMNEIKMFTNPQVLFSRHHF